MKVLFLLVVLTALVAGASADCCTGCSNNIRSRLCSSGLIEGVICTCGNGQLDAGEECDDGNLVSGDGCDCNCQSEAPSCPAGTISVASTPGVCWVQSFTNEDVPTACGRFGLTSPGLVVTLPVPWDATLMAEVTSAMGKTNLGVTSCCTQALWCDATSCFTNNYDTGSSTLFFNFPGSILPSDPVFVCNL